MSEEWTQFLESATVPRLKNVLRSLKLQTTGSKAELKIRTQEAVKDLTEDEFLKLLQEDLAFRNKGQCADDSTSSDDHVSDEDFSDVKFIY